uniref:NUC domain-containing protein n=1 Tax=Loa loa TaxID=7209 RepID=A0A1I7W2V1_LOALO
MEQISMNTKERSGKVSEIAGNMVSSLFIITTVIFVISIAKLPGVVDAFAKTPLLIISLDGFRNSYMEQNITPAIDSLFYCGTHSKYMLPSFPSKTFPNHYTIATGLYPAWHGIVDNRFYDEELGAFFKKSTQKPGWYLGEPIWLTAQKAGLKSAVFFWPGSENSEKLPNYWMKYDSSTPFTSRVDTIIKWLQLPENERPTLIQVYFEEPDLAGHKYGPHSQAVRTALILTDGIINYLLRRLDDQGLMGCINVIIVSDHDADSITSSIMTKLQCQHGNNYLMYGKDTVPIRFHYGGSSRIGDIIISARPETSIFLTAEQNESYTRLGDHGYDNRIDSMRAIFIAFGPDIGMNRVIDSFQNIELYNLFAYLLRIDAAPNNGTDGALFDVLRTLPTIPMTAVDHPPDQCTNMINIKMCNFSHNCPVMDDIYQRCPMIFYSSISASKMHFTGELCRINLCDAIIYFDRKFQKTIMVEGIIRQSIWVQKTNENCVTYIENVMQINLCETPKNDSYSVISLFGNLDRYNTLDLARMIVPKAFSDGIWQYILSTITEYLTKYGNMRFFSGPIYDQNGDGVRDSDDQIRDGNPSHLFFVFMWCANSALTDYTLCKDIIFHPYILPLKDSNLNCLDPPEYLHDNAVRMRDIELLTGMEFFTDRSVWSNYEAIKLRTMLRT